MLIQLLSYSPIHLGNRILFCCLHQGELCCLRCGLLYSQRFTQVDFADGDGVEVPVNMSIYSEVNSTSGGVMQLTFIGYSQWKTNWSYDPDFSILLNPQGGDGGGDGGNNNLLALISLVAIVVVVPVIIIVIVVGLVIVYLRKREMKSRLESIQSASHSIPVNDEPA